MKKNIPSISASLALFFTAIILLSACGPAKTITAPTATLAQSIDSSRWRFTANQVIPQYGGSRVVNGSYEVNINNNKLFVYLPYIGRADAGANTLTGKGPLDFSTDNFSLDKQQDQKGTWMIIIKPKNNSDVQSFNFTFFSNGNASLNVVMNNRSPISYTGLVEAWVSDER